MIENIDSQQPTNRLETRYRDLVQVALMKKSFDHHPTSEEQIDWVEKYGAKVSDILDDPNNEEIRRLAREEKYDEAAELVKKTLSNL